MQSSPQTSFLYTDQDHCVAIHAGTVLSFSLQPPNTGFLTAWAAAMDRLTAQIPGAISVLTVIDAGARTPDDASKAAIKATVLRHRQRIGAFTYVIEGHGFSAAALRSALSLISLAARYPFPQKVFANALEGATWSFGRTPGNSAMQTAAGLAAVVADMRRQVTRFAATG
jgi:hypothetical protein